MDITREQIEDARFEYENEETSFQRIADKYGAYPMWWHRKAKKEGWVKYQPPAENDGGDVITTQRYSGLLSTTAVRKIKEIVEELGIHYNKVDEPMILAYAKNYEYFLKLSKKIDEQGISLVSLKTGSLYTNPDFNAWLAVTKNIASLGEKLGLNITTRKRIGLVLGAPEETEDLFSFVENLEDSELDI